MFSEGVAVPTPKYPFSSMHERTVLELFCHSWILAVWETAALATITGLVVEDPVAYILAVSWVA